MVRLAFKPNVTSLLGLLLLFLPLVSAAVSSSPYRFPQYVNGYYEGVWSSKKTGTADFSNEEGKILFDIDGFSFKEIDRVARQHTFSIAGNSERGMGFDVYSAVEFNFRDGHRLMGPTVYVRGSSIYSEETGRFYFTGHAPRKLGEDWPVLEYPQVVDLPGESDDSESDDEAIEIADAISSALFDIDQDWPPAVNATTPEKASKDEFKDCDWEIYLQFNRNHTEIFHANGTPSVMSGVFVSQNCAAEIKVQEMERAVDTRLVNRTRTFAFFSTIIMAICAVGVAPMMSDNNGTRGRLAVLSIPYVLIVTLFDAVTAMIFMVLSGFVSSAFSACSITAVIAFCISWVIELMIVITVVRLRYENRGENVDRERRARRITMMIYVIFYWVVLLGFALSSMGMKDSTSDFIMMGIFVIIALSPLFQIVHNYRMNTLARYNWFTSFYSLSRLWFCWYMFHISDNIWEAKSRPTFCYGVTALAFVIQCVHWYQLKVGPQLWFGSASKRSYDYSRHPSESILEENGYAYQLTEDECRTFEEHFRGLRASQSDRGSSSDSGTPLLSADVFTARTEDGATVSVTAVTCPICVQAVPVKYESHFLPGVATTPCNHIFHTDCLKQWTEINPSCPSCRTNIPAS